MRVKEQFLLFNKNYNEVFSFSYLLMSSMHEGLSIYNTIFMYPKSLIILYFDGLLLLRVFFFFSKSIFISFSNWISETSKFFLIDFFFWICNHLWLHASCFKSLYTSILPTCMLPTPLYVAPTCFLHVYFLLHVTWFYAPAYFPHTCFLLYYTLLLHTFTCMPPALPYLAPTYFPRPYMDSNGTNKLTNPPNPVRAKHAYRK